MAGLLGFLSSHAAAITLLISVAGGIFAILRWLDARALEQKEKRRQRYERLIEIIIGREMNGDRPVVLQQVVAVWMLSEFKEFEYITKKIFIDRDLTDSSTESWVRCILPEIKEMLSVATTPAKRTLSC